MTTKKNDKTNHPFPQNNTSNFPDLSGISNQLAESEITIKGKNSAGEFIHMKATNLPSGVKGESIFVTPPVNKKSDLKKAMISLDKKNIPRKDIAEMLNVSPGYVSQLLNSGKKKKAKKKH